MDQPSRPSLANLAPVSERYASLPVSQAYTWAASAADIEPGEYYLVAFRSIRHPNVDEAALTAHDDWAHAEAMDAPGFVHYFKGPTTPDGRCMSFCLWTGRAEARAAASRPAHAQAVELTHQAYAEYDLEFHRLTRRDGDPELTFEPYDAPSAQPTGGATPTLTPKLATS